MQAEELPSDGPETVIGTVERLIPLPVAVARQDITAMSAPASVSALINCEPDEAILHVERIYYDSGGTPVEFAVSYYNPRRFSYNLELRRRTSP
jgi:GntR family transcriptional regulator